MAIHKLQLDDFFCADYELIAIHSVLEDYRLAYFINQEVQLQLKKCKPSVEMNTKEGKYSFEHFSFEDKKTDRFWHLVSNKSQTNVATENTNGLFENIEATAYLLPEFKKADYFLKIENIDYNFNAEDTIKKISNITQVSLLYTIEPEKLKSKNNIIF